MGALREEALAHRGVPDAAEVLAAAAPLAAWLAQAPEDAVLDGLAEAADPVGALTGLQHLLEAHPAPPPAAVAGLLRLLGGSPFLAGVLAGEKANWPAAFEAVLAVAARAGDAHARLLAFDAPPERLELQRRLRVHCRREFLRIGGRDLLGLASVDDTVRELSVLAEAVIDAAVGGTRARLEAEWGGPVAGRFAALGMGKLGGGELNYSSDSIWSTSTSATASTRAGVPIANASCASPRR
jgi:glutamine synthetase adenylyltransferase